MIHYPEGHEFPRVEEPEYLTQQQKCSLLVDVGSQMAKDWEYAGTPGNRNDKPFAWTPRSTCEADSATTPVAIPVYGAEYKNFNIDYNLIWTVYSGGLGLVNSGPAAYIATENGHPHTAYIVFRGTLGVTDLIIDAKYQLVANPITKDPANGFAHEGFSEYFEGLGIVAGGYRPKEGAHKPAGPTLYDALNALPGKGIKHLIVTGHSLGSAVSTLVAAFAVNLDIFETVRGSVSASPRVCNPLMKIWFEGLQDKQGNDLQHRFWRLTNTKDGVPELPKENMGPGIEYRDVGRYVWFEADYNADADGVTIPAGQTIGTTVNAGSFVIGTYYAIKTQGLIGKTDFTLIGAVENEPGVIFKATGVGTGNGKADIANLLQANPNHNPCCCYSYAINHPEDTYNRSFNTPGDEFGGDCHFPIIPARTSSASSPTG